MKKLLGIVVLGLLWCNTSFAESSLPPCQGEDDTQWTNCFGTYENKDISKPDDFNELTRSYTGEFGSAPGKREGKGKSKTYKDGKPLAKYSGEYKDDLANGQGTYVDEKRKYVGEYKDGLPNGQGTFTHANGSKYVGEYKDGVMHGQGTYTWSDGEKHVGEYENGKAHGQGTKTYPAGHYEVLKNHGIVYFDKYVGEWVNNERHGQGTITLADGTEHVTEWKNDKFEKVSSEKSELKSEEQVKDEEQSESKDETVTYANGDKYVGVLQDGQRHGQGTMTYANGDEYVGTWSNDQQYARHGKVGTMTYANGDKYVGEFMIDKPYGKGTITYANGDKYVGELRHGHRDEGTMTYANGDKFEGKWDSDDKRSGDGTMTLADGTVYEYYWNDDKPMLSLGLYDIPLIDFSINCRTVNYTSTTTEWFWNRDSMTVKQFTKYGNKFIKALKEAGYSKSQVKQAIEEGREGLTHTIVDWNRSEISYRSRLDDGLYKFDGVEFEMPNGSKYQENCFLNR